MPLRINGARENFHARNPDLRDFRGGAVGGRELAGFDSDLGDELAEGARLRNRAPRLPPRFGGECLASDQSRFGSSENEELFA